MNDIENTVENYRKILENIRNNFEIGKTIYKNSQYGKDGNFNKYLSDKMYNLNNINHTSREQNNLNKGKNSKKTSGEFIKYTANGISKIISECSYKFPSFAFLKQYCDIFDITLDDLFNKAIDYSHHFNINEQVSLTKDNRKNKLINDNHANKSINTEKNIYYCYFPSFSNEEDEIVNEAQMIVQSTPDLAYNEKKVTLNVPRRNRKYDGIMTIHENNTNTVHITCTHNKNYYMIISFYYNQNSEDSKYYGSCGYLIDITSDGSSSPCISKCILSIKKLSDILKNTCNKKWFQNEWFEGLLSIDPHLIAISKKNYLNARKECQLASKVTPLFVNTEDIDTLSDDSILIINVYALRNLKFKEQAKNIRKFIFLLKKRSYTYCNSSRIESIDNRMVRMYIKYIEE